MTETSPRKVLSLGAGVNSTSLLVLKVEGKVDFDCAVFADTGCEFPETYAYINDVIVPYCEMHGIQLEIVKRRNFPPLYQFYYERKLIPSRWLRSCTYKYKLNPIRRFCKAKFGNDFRMVVGIDYGERGRARRWRGTADFPLIDLGLRREDCEQIIKAAGLPLPRKSGCFICPYTTSKEWLNLLKNNRDLYLKSEALEKNNRRYPEFLLRTIPLEELRKKREPPKESDPQKQLCNFGMEKCVFCHE